MNYSIYFNGVYANVLDEIIEAQSINDDLVCYLQPYKPHIIRKLEKDVPTSDYPITAYISVTTDLSKVLYKAKIIGWENKQQLSPERLSLLNKHIRQYQPGETEIYLLNNGKKCMNLISVKNVVRLEPPIPVTEFVKIEKNAPLKLRTQAGGWSYVQSLSKDHELKLSKKYENKASIKSELARRNDLWNQLLRNNSGKSISPKFLRDLGIYGGAAGVWKNTKITGQYTSDGIGIAVSVLHTGDSYPDDLFEDGIIYHYPNTKRNKSFDINEIEATKNCKRFAVPLFIITHSEKNKTLRDVKLGWVEMWDDYADEFLITFSKNQPKSSLIFDENEEFVAFNNASQKRKTLVKVRNNPGRFRIGVLKRYGCNCAVCEIDNPKLLDAAHLIDKQFEGSDDYRNGIVLCKNHHAAFDKKLFNISPETFELIFNNTNAEEIKITKKDISHLALKPHINALKWRWGNR
jgi:putative restriction endonuclease|tara:strand:- start:77 stop:1462 length:1386 start_codon:yes stop_codon:yes gene_type:complete